MPLLISVSDVFLIFIAYVLIAGSLPMSDLSVAFPSGQSAFTSQISGVLPSAGATGDIPLHNFPQLVCQPPCLQSHQRTALVLSMMLHHQPVEGPVLRLQRPGRGNQSVMKKRLALVLR